MVGISHKADSPIHCGIKNRTEKHMVTTAPLPDAGWSYFPHPEAFVAFSDFYQYLLPLLSSPLKSNLSNTWMVVLLVLCFKTCSISQTFLNILDRKLLVFSTMSNRSPVLLHKPPFKWEVVFFFLLNAYNYWKSWLLGSECFITSFILGERSHIYHSVIQKLQILSNSR